jgi:NADPH:quinone reductase-like Zn-dependent oxidoreductase
MTAYRATLSATSVKKDDSVFIAAVGGGVGIFAVQFVRLAGAKSIYTVAKNEKSAQFLREKLGIAQDHIVFYENQSSSQMKEQLVAKNQGRLFNTTLDLVGGETKKLCLELTDFSGHFATILPEPDTFSYPVWGRNALAFARNLSIHEVFVGAELTDPDRRSWAVYPQHMKVITELFESGKFQKPIVQVTGNLSIKTVQQAHALLEEGRVKGKLVMTVA